MVLELAGGEPVIVIVRCRAVTGFKITAGELEKAARPRTKWLTLNSPTNPSGAAFSCDEPTALAKALLRPRHVC
ncbi:aminotransferase class I/II-fold pyridoxal phosphate-dependent enzyme [Paraburkholderia aspalathi]|uniref:aminotransferase class I/II-fold pyridoxal phosphate-dependent enzyme n=1 Tax=Paraburkholderia aspalathi TaxID=1324617 RepID=UPI00244B0CF3|nr:aminotransferase class I/II-fold pyridoxal phosphate-dependent enzyme [Paraburkholderia aspalathi]